MASPLSVLTISQKGNQLRAKATGQGEVDIYPETVNKFFLKVVDAQLEFVKDENNKVSQVILYQNGRKTEGKKIK